MIYLIAAVALVALGVTIGIIVVVSLGVRREDRNYTFIDDPRDPVVRGARRLTGLYVRKPDRPLQPRHRSDDTLV